MVRARLSKAGGGQTGRQARRAHRGIQNLWVDRRTDGPQHWVDMPEQVSVYMWYPVTFRRVL